MFFAICGPGWVRTIDQAEFGCKPTGTQIWGVPNLSQKIGRIKIRSPNYNALVNPKFC